MEDLNEEFKRDIEKWATLSPKEKFILEAEVMKKKDDVNTLYKVTILNNNYSGVYWVTRALINSGLTEKDAEKCIAEAQEKGESVVFKGNWEQSCKVYVIMGKALRGSVEIDAI